MKHLILATAGHVDHGKSALVRALTGVDPDRLPEEKARGITIELGFAELALGDTHLGLIDVPGHEDFVRNMVAGVGSVDLALLVVAADDGWMPQTEEHVQILTFLGVRHAVVALTKADLAVDLDAARAAVAARLAGTPFAGAPIVPTAISQPLSLDALRAALGAVGARTPAPRDIGKPRLAIDRAFTLRGVGTVVTGTLTGGRLRRGDGVLIQPGGAHARVRGVQSHGRELEDAGPGQRVALNLTDAAGVRRGDVIALRGANSALLDVELRGATSLRPLFRTGSHVRVHYGSASVQARVRLVDAEEYYGGDPQLARMTFAEPVFAFVGDRFVVRDSSGRRTLAGGTVLDAAPPELNAAQREMLRARAADPASGDVLLRSLLARDGVAPEAGLLDASRLSSAEIANAAERLAVRGAFVRRAGFVVDAIWWNAARERAEEAIKAHHRAHPEEVGLSLALLRARLGFRDVDLAGALVSELETSGYTQVGAAIKRTTHRPKLPPALEAAGLRIRLALGLKPLEPPPRKELGVDPASQQALRFLVQTGEAVELSAELAMSAAGFAQARERVARRLRERGAATTSELREVLGTNRRVIVPLLERLDKDGVTRRIGDKRVLRD